MAFLIWVLLGERFGNLGPGRNPYTFFLANVVNEVSECLEPTRSPDNAAVQSNGHHLRLSILTLLVKRIECILEMGVKAIWVAEARSRSVEFEIVAIVRVRSTAR